MGQTYSVPVICLLSHSSSVSIEIQNSGFESDTVSYDNTFHYGTNLLQPWERYDPFNIMVDWSTGVMNPTGGTSFDDPTHGDSAPEGTQNGYLDIDTADRNKGQFGIAQTLTGHTVTVGTTYTLSAWIGNLQRNTWSAFSTEPSDSYDVSGFPGYKVQLLAGNNILIEDNNQLSIAEGHWAQSVISITISPGNPHVGQTLAIRLVNNNVISTSGLAEVCFDGIRLEATTMSPTLSPTSPPTYNPTKAPSKSPTMYPSVVPTSFPSDAPTESPSIRQTTPPSITPTVHPSTSPSEPTIALHVHEPTYHPSSSPVVKVMEPTDYTETTQNREDDVVDPNDTDSLDWIWIPVLLIIAVIMLCIAFVCGLRFIIKQNKQEVFSKRSPKFKIDRSKKMPEFDRIASGSMKPAENAINTHYVQDSIEMKEEPANKAVFERNRLDIDHEEGVNQNEIDVQETEGDKGFDHMEDNADEDSDTSLLNEINETTMGENNQNEKNIEYNMDAEGDAIVNNDDEITAGNELKQTNHNMNAIGAHESGGMNVEQCVDCGAVKEGKKYDGDGLFYCKQCYDYYVVIGNNHGGVGDK